MSEPIKVFGYLEFQGLPDLSPFVSKLEGYLRLADVPYEKCLGDFRKAPRGKLPFITHGAEPIPDSQRIIEYLARKGVADLDAWLDPDQRAELFALRSMLETDLYFIVVYFRWKTDAGWAHYRVGISEVLRAAGVPGFLIPALLGNVRKGPIKQLHAQGTGRRDADENLGHAREMFATLDRFLAKREGPWWFGDKPSSADAIIHAFVSAAIVPKMDIPIQGLADPHPRLREWFERVDAKVRPQA